MPPPDGALYLYCPASVDKLPKEQRHLYKPETVCGKIKIYEFRQRILDGVLEVADPLDKVPRSVAQKINRPDPTMIL